jgi:hypothetical protein
LKDYQARVWQPFPHAEYASQLTGLRDRLKAALSGAEQKEGEPTIAELAERIKALRAANTVEATTERTATRRLPAEEPVRTRIRRRVDTCDTPGPASSLATNPEITHRERLAQSRERQNCLEATP